MLEGIISRTILVMIGKRTLRAPRLSIATIPQQLALAAPCPFILKSRRFSGIVLKFIVSAAGMVVHSALNARAGGWIARIGKAIALGAPPPVILPVGRCVVQQEGVEAASNTDVGTAGGAVGVAVESEEVALVTPAPLVLPSWWFSIDGQRVEATAGVVMLASLLARSRSVGARIAKSLTFVAPFPSLLSSWSIV